MEFNELAVEELLNKVFKMYTDTIIEVLAHIGSQTKKAAEQSLPSVNRSSTAHRMSDEQKIGICEHSLLMTTIIGINSALLTIFKNKNDPIYDEITSYIKQNTMEQIALLMEHKEEN